METRNFVVELHTDGRMTWAEYIEPACKEDLNKLCGRAFQQVAEKLKTYPCSLWPNEVKASYLNGASHMLDILRDFL